MISTRDLSKLPEIDTLKRVMQGMAMLDAIITPVWEFRLYSFNSKWSNGEQMGSMRSGSGDDLFALFNCEGCFLKGFWHESDMSPYGNDDHNVWPGVLDSVPEVFATALHQAAFSMSDTTFCIWRQNIDNSWRCGEIRFPKFAPRYAGQPNDPDGSEWLLSPYDGKPETYLASSHTASLKLEHVQHVYAHEPLTAKLVAAINPKITLEALAGDIDQIGYPRRKA